MSFAGRSLEETSTQPDIAVFSGGSYACAMGTVLRALVIVLAMPSLAVAETIVYFLGHAWEVPSPLVLLVCGLALIAVGIGLQKWVGRIRVPSGAIRRVSGREPGSPR